MSYKYPFEIRKFSMYLSTIPVNNINEHRIKVHTYLSMYLHKPELDVVKITMRKYLQKVLG